MLDYACTYIFKMLHATLAFPPRKDQLMTTTPIRFEQLSYLLTDIETHVAQLLQRQHRIGLSEYRALQHLAAAKQGELRIQELGTRLHLSQSAVSRLVLRLERDGLAIRDLCPNDKRGVYSVLTETGRDKLKMVAVDYPRYYADAIAQASAASTEHQDLLKLLQCMDQQD